MNTFWRFCRSGVGPLGLSTQYETQRDSSSKVIYFKMGWLCSFVCKVTSSRFELKEYFSSFYIRVCPKSQLEQLRSVVLPFIFPPFTTAGSLEHDNVLLAALRSIAADPNHCSSVRLGNFSLYQMDRLEKLFEPQVECRGTSSLTPCGMNSYHMWKKLGWPCIPAS